MCRPAVLVSACLAIALAAPARAQTPDAPGARRPAPARGGPSEEQASLLRQLADAQKWAGEQLWAVKESVDALPGTLNELKDQVGANEDEVRKVREEVKGLYVELASLREQLEAARADVTAVDSNLSAFRTFAGVFIAVMILLLAVISVMTIRR